MSYNNEARAKMYYCAPGTSVGASTRIVPAPQISINPEIYYANDTVIGYTYNITLNGYADSIRRDQTNRPQGESTSGIEQVVSHINDIRDIFKGNGGILYLYDNGGKLVLKAKGATIKNLKFDESENKWINYAPYSIEIEFNEVDFLGCNNNAAIPCAGSFFHTDQSKTTTSDNLVDFKKYKLKNFSDTWTFDINNELHNQNYFTVTYNLSATGKHYYDSQGKLIPAWLQAKNFVQERLYQQIKALIDNAIALSNSSDDNGCSATFTADQLYARDQTNSLLENFDTNTINYRIYNESISCNTSESEGSFSVTYNAIISSQDLSNGENGSNALHTYTQSISTSDQGGDFSTTISVQGTVQGLIRGGIIDYTNNDFNLPQNGTFISKHSGNTTKYSNALNFYNTIVGGNTDLNSSFKTSKNITKQRLLIPGTGSPSPSSFVLDHNYHEGSVTYSAQYDSKLNRTLDQGYVNISIVKNDRTPLYNEFVIPGRTSGPLIQLLGAYKPKTISISIEGANALNKSCTISDLCLSVPYVGSLYNQLSSLEGSTLWIKTNEQYTKNNIDGSFSMNVEYTCTT
jgi:hypothetical protein